MPIPTLTPSNRCTAIGRRNGKQCLNLAAWGCKTCRMHGAHKPQPAKIGEAAPNYQHGRFTREAMEARRSAIAELQYIEKVGFLTGILKGHRTRGRRSEVPGYEVDTCTEEALRSMHPDERAKLKERLRSVERGLNPSGCQ